MKRKELMKPLKKTVTRAFAMLMVSGMVLSPMGEMLVSAADYPYNVMTNKALNEAASNFADSIMINVSNLRDSHVTMKNDTAYFNITKDGTYHLTGSNYINGVYVETQIVVQEGVQATLILDNLQIKNQKGKAQYKGCGIFDTVEQGTSALIVNGTADLFVIEDSTLETGYSSEGCVAINKGGSLTVDTMDEVGILSINSIDFCPGIYINGDFTMKGGKLKISADVGIGNIKDDIQYGDITIEDGSIDIILPNPVITQSDVYRYASGICYGNRESSESKVLISGGDISIQGESEMQNGYAMKVNSECIITGGCFLLGSSENLLMNGIALFGNEAIISGGTFTFYGKTTQYYNGTSYGNFICVDTIIGGQFISHLEEDINCKIDANNISGGNYLLDEYNMSENGYTLYQGTLSDVTEPANIISMYAFPSDSTEKPAYYGLKDAVTTADGEFCFLIDKSKELSSIEVTFESNNQLITKKYTVGDESDNLYRLTETQDTLAVHKVTIHNLDTDTDEIIYSSGDGTVAYLIWETETGYSVYYKDAEMTTTAPDSVTADTTVYVKEKSYEQVEVRDYTTGEVIDSITTDKDGNYTLKSYGTGYKTHEYFNQQKGSDGVEYLGGDFNISQYSVVYLDAEKYHYTVIFQDEYGTELEKYDSCEYGDSVSYTGEDENKINIYKSFLENYISKENLNSVQENMIFEIYPFEKYTDENGKEYIIIDSKEDFIRFCSTTYDNVCNTKTNLYLTSNITLNTTEYEYGTDFLNNSIVEGNGHTITLTHNTTESEFNGLFGYLHNTTIQNLKLDLQITGKTSTYGCMVGNGYNNTFINCSLTGNVAPISEKAHLCYEMISLRGEESFINCTIQGTDDVTTAFLGIQKKYQSIDSTLKYKNCYVSSAQTTIADGYNASNQWYFIVKDSDINIYNINISLDIKNSCYAPLKYEKTYLGEDIPDDESEISVSSRAEAVNAIIKIGIEDIYGVTGSQSNAQLSLLAFDSTAGSVHSVTYYDENNDCHVIAGVSGDNMTEEDKETVGDSYYYNDESGKQTAFSPDLYTFGQNTVIYKNGQNIEPQLKLDKATKLTSAIDVECEYDLAEFLQDAPSGYSYSYSFADGTDNKYYNLVDKYAIEDGKLKVIKKFETEDSVDVIVNLVKGEKTIGQTIINLSVNAVEDTVAPVIKNGTTVLGTASKGYTYCGSQTFVIEDKFIDSVTFAGKNVTLTNGTVKISVPSGKTTTGLMPLKATDKSGNSITVYVCVNSGHSYGKPVFTWNGYKATAVFKCTIDQKAYSKTATITSKVTKAATYSATGIRTYTATVSLNGNTYTSTKTQTLAKLARISIAKASVTNVTNKNYTGYLVTQSGMAVKIGTKTLKNGTDYTVSYSNNRYVGTATITITGKGAYTGTVKKTFKISISKGKTYTVNSRKYYVTDARTDGNGTVTLVGITSKKDSLTSLTIGNTVKISGKTYKITAIGTSAFSGFTKLTKVTLGANIKSIQAKAFYKCTKLATITVKTTKLTWVGDSAIKGIKSTAFIDVPSARVSNYKRLFKSNTGYKSTMKLK